jgi:H+/gluconate symporter-like permease
MDFDIGTALIFGLLIMVPAVVVFIILMVQRTRRGKFHRQRITKKSSRPQE